MAEDLEVDVFRVAEYLGPFFGQDRLDLLRWRLAQHGLRERG